MSGLIGLLVAAGYLAVGVVLARHYAVLAAGTARGWARHRWPVNRNDQGSGWAERAQRYQDRDAQAFMAALLACLVFGWFVLAPVVAVALWITVPVRQLEEAARDAENAAQGATGEVREVLLDLAKERRARLGR